MLPILLIHGYSSEGKDTSMEEIYGSLPSELREWLGPDAIRELNLSRWISLNDGISLDDVSFAMDRALRSTHPDLLETGFHVIIHSTGALVVRNWIRNFSAKPSPVVNLVHLAGANFGSGLAHIGKGQLARWGRQIAFGTGSGIRILNELEFGSWKTLDLHAYFLATGCRMREDYQVQEFCLVGSQIPKALRLVPIRYVKEDSSDCTVRTAAGNLNFTRIVVGPDAKAASLSHGDLEALTEDRLENRSIAASHYEIKRLHKSDDCLPIPFAIPYETAHFSEDIGIVTGSKNRNSVMPLIKAALETPFDASAYLATGKVFAKALAETFTKAAKLDASLMEWHPQKQYEGHSQLIFRIRDQNGEGVEHFDLYFNSPAETEKDAVRLESCIEDKHLNKNHGGTITFYLRTQAFDGESGRFDDLLERIAPLDLEVSGHEPLSGDIAYLPMTIRLSSETIRDMLQSFQTTVVDITLMRIPSRSVFATAKG